MFPEVGYFALIFALIASITQVGLSLWGELRRAPYFLSLNSFLSLLQAVGTGISFASLAYAFLTDDFSVIYVAQHSNSQLPDFFKFAATWGGHEGSPHSRSGRRSFAFFLVKSTACLPTAR